MRKFSSGSVPGSQLVYINLSSVAKQQLPLVATDFGRVAWLFRATAWFCQTPSVSSFQWSLERSTFVLEPNTFVVLHAASFGIFFYLNIT